MKMSIQSLDLRFAMCKCTTNHCSYFYRALTDKTRAENPCVIYREKSQEIDFNRAIHRVS